MIGDVKMQTVKRRTGRSLTGDRPLFLALQYYAFKWLFFIIFKSLIRLNYQYKICEKLCMV